MSVISLENVKRVSNSIIPHYLGIDGETFKNN